MNPNNFDFDAYVQELLDNTTPDELFDFFEKQGMFNSLKDKPAVSLELNTEPIFAPYQSEFGKTVGQNTVGLLDFDDTSQLIAA